MEIRISQNIYDTAADEVGFAFDGYTHMGLRTYRDLDGSVLLVDADDCIITINSVKDRTNVTALSIVSGQPDNGGYILNAGRKRNTDFADALCTLLASLDDVSLQPAALRRAVNCVKDKLYVAVLCGWYGEEGYSFADVQRIVDEVKRLESQANVGPVQELISKAASAKAGGVCHCKSFDVIEKVYSERSKGSLS